MNFLYFSHLVIKYVNRQSLDMNFILLNNILLWRQSQVASKKQTRFEHSSTTTSSTKGLRNPAHFTKVVKCKMSSFSKNWTEFSIAMLMKMAHEVSLCIKNSMHSSELQQLKEECLALPSCLLSCFYVPILPKNYSDCTSVTTIPLHDACNYYIITKI